jgi:hypothetical protein
MLSLIRCVVWKSPLDRAANAIALAVLFTFASRLAAEDAPLHERIDSLIEAKAGGPLAPQADDAEFVRRLYLDLAGRIPTADETRAFLDDPAPDKRVRLIDRLLGSDDHVARMEQVLHVMLMERLGEHEEWSKYLHDSVAANKPWDQMVREMLNPNPDDEATRGSAFFYSKRLENYGQNPVDIPALVRDVGRLFMGIDVQCAQCHDHLFVDDYKQEYYQGLFAFVGHLSLRTDVKFPAVAEKTMAKKVDFVSVFVQQPKSIGPKLPEMDEVAIPVFAKGEEFEIKPDPKKKIPGKLKFSTLPILAEQLPTADNQLFTRNIANRLWWLMMGRGLVHPLDLQHTGNPPSHPELLDLLGKELAAHQFDMRWLLRELALSRTYQRSSRFVESMASVDEIPPESYRLALEKPLLAEQMLVSVAVATETKIAGLTLDPKPGTEMPASVRKSLEPVTKKFAAAFANPPRDPEVDHHPALRGALFLMNDDTVMRWLEPKEGNLTDRLAKLDDNNKTAEELYLSILSRRPTDAERQEVADYFSKNSDRRPIAIRQLAWALLASNEFSVNH